MASSNLPLRRIFISATRMRRNAAFSLGSRGRVVVVGSVVTAAAEEGVVVVGRSVG